MNPQLKEYDLILASHRSTYSKVRNLGGYKIHTCHGTSLQLEHPMQGMDKYVAVSQEVANFIAKQGFDSEVIVNGVDTERFYPKKPINSTLKSIFSLSQSNRLNNQLKSICNKRGIKFRSLNKFINPQFKVEDYIIEADMVVSLGRGAYESMSCGRVVFCLDNRAYISPHNVGDGLLTPDNVNDSIKFNCSGRFSRTVFNEDDINRELDKYTPLLGEFSRKFALENLNISIQADKYLNLKP